MGESSGVPFGLVTPRYCLAELTEIAKETPGDAFKVKRYKQILKHMERQQFHGRSLADTPMSLSAFDAEVKRAWHEIQNGPDEIERMIRHMAAQGRA